MTTTVQTKQATKLSADEIGSALGSFGIDTRPASSRWSEIMRGPSKAEVSAHVAKLASFAAHFAK